MDDGQARAWLDALGEFHMEFGLDRVRAVLAALGNPERCAPAIHVAGTNGKGATCAFASSILRHAGKRVGLYTSPHLSRPNERIALSGRPIDDAGFSAALAAVREASERTRTPLTYFEAMTCAGFWAFREAKVEAMVVEVGLGGRLDATNVLDPAVSVITSISLDHMHLLGDTIEKIAAEKAGIVKPGRPVVVAPNEPVVLDLVRRRASATVWSVCRGEYPGWEAAGPGKDAACLVELRLPPDGAPLRAARGACLAVLPLRGAQFAEAAATAATAVRVADPGMPARAIVEGLEGAKWPGRFELAPLLARGGAQVTVILDGAHNPAAARALAAAVPGGRVDVLLFAAMADKDVRHTLAALAPLAPREVFVTTAGLSRSATPGELAEHARVVFGDRATVHAVPSVDGAFRSATAHAGESGQLLVVGSLYLVGRVRELIHERAPDAIG